MKWCRHMDFSKDCLPLDERSHVAIMMKHDWQFCPICSAPRPKERTLEEKMADRLNGFYKHRLIEADILTIAHALSQTAEEHFRDKT